MHDSDDIQFLALWLKDCCLLLVIIMTKFYRTSAWFIDNAVKAQIIKNESLLCYAAVTGRCIVNWLSCGTTFHVTAREDINICPPASFLLDWSEMGRTVLKVLLCHSKTKLSTMWWQFYQPEWVCVGVCTPTRFVGITEAGRGDLTQACGLLLLIRSIGLVCTGFSSRMTIPDPDPCSPSFSPLVLPALSSMTIIHLYEMGSLSFSLMCNWH